MAFFDEERYKNSSEPEWDIMIVLRSTQPSTNRHKSGLGMRLHLPYYSM